MLFSMAACSNKSNEEGKDENNVGVEQEEQENTIPKTITITHE